MSSIIEKILSCFCCIPDTPDDGSPDVDFYSSMMFDNGEIRSPTPYVPLRSQDLNMFYTDY